MEEEEEEGEEEEEQEEENDETSSKFDSGSEIEQMLDEDGITTDQPKLNVRIPNSADNMMEEGGSHQNSAEVLRSSAANVLESNELCVKEVMEKEPVDFETCIIVNEISKYDQNEGKISKVMDVPCKENNGGSGTLVVDQHVMDFEAEIAASQISKQKPVNGRGDYNTQILVENQGTVSEMKEVNMTVPGTSETFTRDGEQGGEKFDFVLGEKEEQVRKEKLIEGDANSAIQLLCTDITPVFLQQDAVIDVTMKEEEALPDRTGDAGASNFTVQQVGQEGDTGMSVVKARETSENSSPFVETPPPCSDLEERSQNVKPQKTSSRATSVSRDIISVDANAETRDLKLSKGTEVTTGVQNTVPEVSNKSCIQKRKIHKGSVVASLVQGRKTRKTESCELEADRSDKKAIPADEANSNKKTNSKLSTKEQAFYHGLKTVETESHERSISQPIEGECVGQGDSEIISEEYCRKKTHESFSEAEISQNHALFDSADAQERKLHTPSRREECVLQHGVMHVETESNETETHEGRKVLKHTVRASSVECEGFLSDILTGDRKAQKPSSRTDSVECENAASYEIQACEIKVCGPSSKLGSVQCEDVQSDDTEIYDKKVYKPSSTARCGQNKNIPSDETETSESKVLKPSSTSSYIQDGNVPSDKVETYERETHKPSSRASSVQPDDVPSDKTEICKRKACKPSRTASSVPPENVPSGETEIYERKVCRSSNRASSAQHDVPSDESKIQERKIRRPSSVGCEDVPLDETVKCARKVRRPSSRASSVEHENTVQDETETCERKVHKLGNRAGFLQHEVVPPKETETLKRKVHKRRSRASSLQPEDILLDAAETQESEVHRHSSRSNSVQRENAPSEETETFESNVHNPCSRDSSVQTEAVPSGETVTNERKHCKPSSRAGSSSDEITCYDVRSCGHANKVSVLQQEGVPLDKTESADRKNSKCSSSSGSIECKYVSSTDIELCDHMVHTSSSREGSVQSEDDPVEEIDEHEDIVYKSSKRGSSVKQQVALSNETGSVERRVCRSRCRASSVQRNCLDVIVEEEPCNVEGDKTGSSDCRDVTLSADSAVNENRQPRALSVNSSASSVVLDENAHFAGHTKKRGIRSRHLSTSSQCSFIQDDEMDVDVKFSSKKNRQSGSIQQSAILDVDERPEDNTGITTIKEPEIATRAVSEIDNIAGVSAKKRHTDSLEKVVDSSQRKTKKKCKQAGSSRSNCGAATSTTSAVKCPDIEDSDAETEGSSVTRSISESKGVTDKSKKDSAAGDVHDIGSAELNAPLASSTPADVRMNTGDKEEKTQETVSVFGLSNQGISSPSLLLHEMFRFKSDAAGKPFRKARSESEYVTGLVIESRRFTRSMSGISTRTRTTDIGLVTDNSASAKKSRRSDVGQEGTGHSLEMSDATHGDGSCSEMSSGSSVKWKRKAYSTNRGDSSIVQQAMEEYTMNRRLTRHQRTVLERSLELTMQPVPQLR
jgi:hypothetical protein